ncbi:hypothetical protein M408DRAFT_8026 [Serendipita vermifera MAFF 305830]|uniref:Uncharacterized protein n=1 Tax=Serendipita vermifera MAFF 305830 TaxID=933852 RepID=A0A0C2WUD4_SERVB|nr:hypothetical protein M408DRAFT_8026 [Serendipita vermifera MAFF 305830]
MLYLIDSEKDAYWSQYSLSGASTVVVDQFLKDNDAPLWSPREDDALFLFIAKRILQRLIETVSIPSPEFIDLLRLRLEAIVTKDGTIVDAPSCLYDTFGYCTSIISSDPELVSLHHDFTLILARSLASYTGMEKLRRVKELLIMVWAPFNWMFEVEFIKDPCLKFFAKYITSSDVESISFDFWDVNSSFRDSWARIAKHLIYQYHAADTPYVLQLQSVVWPTISDEEAGLCKRALTDPTALAHLQRIFEYPIACQHHHDHGGHLFLHLFQKGPELTIPVDIKTYPGVSLEGRLMNFGLFYLLLTSIGPENLALGISSANVSSDCLAQIIEICKAIQASPSSLFGLLCDFTDAIIDRGVCSEELIAISICVNKAFDQPRDPRATPLILPLIKSILRVRDTMLSMQYRSPEENELASTNAMKVIDRLYAYLASTMLFNGQSSRNLSCARALKTCNQVAIGWLPPYE